MANGGGVPDERTGKVIQLYATPETPSREQVRRRHPSQQAVARPGGARPGGDGASRRRTGADGRSGSDGAPERATKAGESRRPTAAEIASGAVTPISEDVALHGEIAEAGSRGGSILGGLRGAVAGSLTSTASFVRERLTGEYEIDDFGFDEHFADNIVLPTLRVLFDKWFHVEVTGAENLPLERGALLVANHAGTLPLDALMTTVAVHDHHPRNRHLRILAADLAFESPFVSEIARSTGATLACVPDAERLLESGELTAVWPEGYKGLGKPYRDRYKLQRFGRGGFVTTALRTGVPIIPVSIVGSEEIYPKIGDLKPLARLLGFPYFPVTPTFPLLGPLGVIPLPSRWHIHFGQPIETARFDDQAADDPMVVFDLTDQVREDIQQTLYRMLSRRDRVWF